MHDHSTPATRHGDDHAHPCARGVRRAPGSRPVQLGVLLGHGRLHQLAHGQAQGHDVRRPSADRGRTRRGSRGEPALPARRRAPDRDRTQPIHACAATARAARYVASISRSAVSSANESTCPTPAPKPSSPAWSCARVSDPARRPRRDPPRAATRRTVQLRRARRGETAHADALVTADPASPVGVGLRGLFLRTRPRQR